MATKKPTTKRKLKAIPGGRADEVRELRPDGWANILTGLGQISRDKRTATSFSSDVINWQQAQELWRGNDMASKVITKLPKEALRRGFDVRVQGDDAEGSKETEEAIEQQLVKLDTSKSLYDALCFERAYGGGAILLGAQDGMLGVPNGLREPLNEAKLQSIDFLTVFPAFELYASAWYSNPLAPKYGMPARYRLMPHGIVDAAAYNLDIHESRLLIFPGVVVSRQQTQQNQGWGDSVLARVNEVLKDFGATWGGVANLLQDFAQALYKIKGLSQMVAQNQDAKVLQRMQLIDIMRSTIRGVMLDSEEDFKRETTSLAGIPEVLQQFALRMAAAAEMPVSLLLGQAPAGLNATGASDVRFYYDDVASEQTQRLLPRINRLVRLLQLCKKGPTKGVEIPKWSVIFRTLWQMTEQETEQLRLTVAQRDKLYIDTGVLTKEEVAQSRFGGDAWSPETVIDLQARLKAAQTPAPIVTPAANQTTTSPLNAKKDQARADEGQGGVMIALYPLMQDALDLVVPGGEPSHQLHLTLCYLGRAEALSSEQALALRQVCDLVASENPPVDATVAGIGRFPAAQASDGLDVLWAAVDGLTLPSLREALVAAIQASGVPYAPQHGFQPHITLAYLSPEEASPLYRLSPHAMRLGVLTLAIGDQHFNYPLGGAT